MWVPWFSEDPLGVLHLKKKAEEDEGISWSRVGMGVQLWMGRGGFDTHPAQWPGTFEPLTPPIYTTGL